MTTATVVSIDEAKGPVVYVLTDATDAAIYVGATRDVTRRLREHHAKPWWEHVRDVEVFPANDWPHALFIERGLIHALSPEFNRQSVDPTRHILNQAFGPSFRRLGEAMSA